MTYDWALHPTAESLLILGLYAGYGQQATDSGGTGPAGQPVTLNMITGGIDVGVNAILPVSQHWAIFAGAQWYPGGFASFQLGAPGTNLNKSTTVGAPQSTYSVGVRYTTASPWGFSLGYQWSAMQISPINLSVTTSGGQTLGGAACPCTSVFSGFTFGVSKSF